jgi:hypothetical protein
MVALYSAAFANNAPRTTSIIDPHHNDHIVDVALMVCIIRYEFMYPASRPTTAINPAINNTPAFDIVSPPYSYLHTHIGVLYPAFFTRDTPPVNATLSKLSRNSTLMSLFRGFTG